MFLETSRTCSCIFPEIRRNSPRNFLDIFRTFTGNVWKCPGNFLDISWICPGNFQEHSWKFPGNSPEILRDMSLTFPRISWICPTFPGHFPDFLQHVPGCFLNIRIRPLNRTRIHLMCMGQVRYSHTTYVYTYVLCIRICTSQVMWECLFKAACLIDTVDT